MYCNRTDLAEVKLGSDCRVTAIDYEGSEGWLVETRADFGWRIGCREKSREFPGTAVLFGGEWYEVVSREERRDEIGVVWLFGLAEWQDSEVIRDSFELSERGVADALARWRAARKPFSLKQSFLALVVPLTGLALVVGPPVVLMTAVFAWARRQAELGLLTAGQTRLVALAGLIAGISLELVEIGIFRRWLQRIVARYPWMETERWHGLYGLLFLLALGVVAGGFLLWSGRLQMRAFGLGLIVVCFAAMMRAWTDPELS